MKIKVGISNRHVHLCKEDYDLLFDDELKKECDLSQDDEFKSDKRVILVGPKGQIENVAVLGPFRDYSQVEISRTDSFRLGVNPCVKSSGDLCEREVITIVGEKGSIVRDVCIIATRHIHINHDDRIKYNLLDDKYRVFIDTVKGGIMDNVYIKEEESGVMELHIDMDDANAFFLNQGDEVEIIKSDNN